MIEYNELSFEEKTQISTKALAFYNKHSKHVKLLLKDQKIAVAPSGSDMFRPELWKAIHWHWFNQVITLV